VVTVPLSNDLKTGQGGGSVLGEVEYLIQSSDGENAPGRRRDAAKDQLSSTILQRLPQFEEPGEYGATRHVNVGEIHDHVVVTASVYNLPNGLQLLVC